MSNKKRVGLSTTGIPVRPLLRSKCGDTSPLQLFKNFRSKTSFSFFPVCSLTLRPWDQTCVTWRTKHRNESYTARTRIHRTPVVACENVEPHANTAATHVPDREACGMHQEVHAKPENSIPLDKTLRSNVRPIIRMPARSQKSHLRFRHETNHHRPPQEKWAETSNRLRFLIF